MALKKNKRPPRPDDSTESTGRYADLYDFAPFGYLTHDTGGRILEANLTAAEQLGRGRDSLINKSFSRLILQNDRPVFLAHCEEVMKMKTRLACDVRIRRKDRSEFHAQLVSIARRENPGDSSSIRTAIINITDQKRSEERLRESEAKFRSLYEGSLDGYAKVDRNGLIIEFNSAFRKMLGYKPDELKKLTYRDIVPEKWRKKEAEMMSILLRDGHSPLWEMEHIRKDGIIFPVELRAYLSKDSRGSPIAVWAFVRDITERRDAEDALHHALILSQKRQTEASALLDSARAVLLNPDFSDAARSIFDICKQVTGATSGYVSLLSSNGKEHDVLLLDSGGIPCRADSHVPMPVRGLPAKAYKSGIAVYHNTFSGSKWSRGMPDQHMLLRNVLLVPLSIDGAPVGILGLANKQGDFTDDDGRLASAFGEILSIALNNSTTLELLENSEENFRSVAETAHDAIITIDSQGEVIYWNRGAENMFGYSASEMVGTPVSSIIPEGLRSFHTEGLETVASGERFKYAGKTVEIAGLTKKGTTFPIELSLSKWKSGRGDFFTGIIRDITERKQIEEELSSHRKGLMELVSERTSELRIVNAELEQEIRERTEAVQQKQLMALFAEMNPSPVLRYDTSGRVTMANPSALRIFGIDSLAGVTVRDIIPGAEELDLEACVRNGSVVTHSAQLGDRFYYFIFKGIPDMAIGQIYGSDITDQKRAEAEIVRAGHLASLGELAAGVAHEINNPINGIINYSQILSSRARPGTKEHDISLRIIKEGDRIAGIVKNLLSFAREIKEKKRLVDVMEVLSDALALTETQLKKDGVRLNVSVGEDLPRVFVQPQQIEQVFLNIISNARYALNLKHPEPHRDKLLEIRVGTGVLANLPCIRIIFKDYGSGMSTDVRNKIINPFFTTKPSGVGTGLGLSISHGIITDHGGRISIDSLEGKSTTVAIELPLKEMMNQTKKGEDRDR